MAPLSQAAPGQRPDLSIPQYFASLKDPRRAHRRLHLLQDLIVIALCAVIAGAQDWQQTETFGRKRRDWLRRLLALPHGIPSHDTFERVFNRLNPQAFQACFRGWVRAITAALRIKHVAIDGKTLRGSGSARLGPLHLVSAWATAQHLSLGQVAVGAKSNEITAIPALLGLLDLNGALVTIDAMGCQKAIARKVVDQGGHASATQAVSVTSGRTGPSRRNRATVGFGRVGGRSLIVGFSAALNVSALRAYDTHSVPGIRGHFFSWIVSVSKHRCQRGQSKSRAAGGIPFLSFFRLWVG